jgi:hypothetical protein
MESPARFWFSRRVPGAAVGTGLVSACGPPGFQTTGGVARGPRKASLSDLEETSTKLRSPRRSEMATRFLRAPRVRSARPRSTGKPSGSSGGGIDCDGLRSIIAAPLPAPPGPVREENYEKKLRVAQIESGVNRKSTLSGRNCDQTPEMKIRSQRGAEFQRSA